MVQTCKGSKVEQRTFECSHLLKNQCCVVKEKLKILWKPPWNWTRGIQYHLTQQFLLFHLISCSPKCLQNLAQWHMVRKMEDWTRMQNSTTSKLLLVQLWNLSLRTWSSSLYGGKKCFKVRGQFSFSELI